MLIGRVLVFKLKGSRVPRVEFRPKRIHGIKEWLAMVGSWLIGLVESKKLGDMFDHDIGDVDAENSII